MLKIERQLQVSYMYEINTTCTKSTCLRYVVCYYFSCLYISLTAGSDRASLSQLLKFCTGLDGVPPMGLAERITIYKISKNTTKFGATES